MSQVAGLRAGKEASRGLTILGQPLLSRSLSACQGKDIEENRRKRMQKKRDLATQSRPPAGASRKERSTMSQVAGLRAGAAAGRCGARAASCRSWAKV